MKTMLLSGFSIVVLVATIANAQTFTDLHNGFPSLTNASAAWGDYDHDSLPDLALIGFSSSTAEVSQVYHNDGAGTFSLVHTFTIQVSDGAACWGDYDHDGDLDLLINGQNGSGAPVASTTLARNDGSGLFTETPVDIPGVIGVARWIDYDGDGWLDVITSGMGISLIADSTRLFHNDTNGTFSEVSSNLPGYVATDIAVVDYNKDGNMDFFLTGGSETSTMFPVATLYQNNGTGNFTEVPFPFKKLSTGTAAWADYDHDGDMDLLYDGIDSTFADGYSLLYRNDSAGNFTFINANLPGSGEPGSVDWADIDNDGDLDILLGGPTYLLRNDANTYTDITPADFPHAVPTSFADIDNDGDPDILFASSSTIFRNDLLITTGESAIQHELTISPNPAKDKLVITLNEKQPGITQLEIHNLLGELVYSHHYQNKLNLVTLDGLAFSKGIFMINVWNGERTFSKKLIIE